MLGRARFIQSVFVALDDVGGSFPCSQGRYEFLLDAGDVGVEDGLGFGAERFHDSVAEGLVVETGFRRVNAAELLPMGEEIIGGDSFRMGQEEAVERALHRVEV